MKDQDKEQKRMKRTLLYHTSEMGRIKNKLIGKQQ